MSRPATPRRRAVAEPDDDQRLRLRWAAYSLLIALAVGQAAGKILAVDSVDVRALEKTRVTAAVARAEKSLRDSGLEGEALQQALADRTARIRDQLRLERPFLSGNDRSRWMAIRAIVENGAYEIDPFLEEPTWDTLDMVQHEGRDGRLHLYSSKPPLLMLLLAAPYWVIVQATGMTLGAHPWVVGRMLLTPLNCGAVALLLFSVARLVERFGRGDAGRVLSVAAAALANQLAAFTPVLNNHLIAAAAAALSVDLWASLADGDRRQSAGRSAAAGLAAAFLVTCELPGLALAALIALSLLVRRPAETLRGFAPAAAAVAVAFFAANYWAHGRLSPPYAHRHATAEGENWYDYEYTARGKLRQSYWRNPEGLDRGETSRVTYALHATLGHHGVYSLTPIWALSLVGAALWLASGAGARRELGAATLAVTAACLVFYLGLRPQADRNYGGSTNGFRWLFWITPLWSACLAPIGDRLARSALGWAVVCAAIAWGAMSAAYATWNPWSHPWLYQWMRWLGFDLL